MIINSRILSRGSTLRLLKKLGTEAKQCSTRASGKGSEFSNIDTFSLRKDVPMEYRLMYPEFLPDPNPLHRNFLREKLERIDMLKRRSVIKIPEFYVGSILAVTHSEPHAPNKLNRFVGICIQKLGTGLRATFILRNVIDNQGVEMLYNMYDPTIRTIECLKLEKRLDNELLYLRDAPLEYSTIPFDMEPIMHVQNQPVPVNDIKIVLNPLPWLEKWERKELKGVIIHPKMFSLTRRRKLKALSKPWEKFDLMKIYRETIPEEEQQDIFVDVQKELENLETLKRKSKKKSG